VSKLAQRLEKRLEALEAQLAAAYSSSGSSGSLEQWCTHHGFTPYGRAAQKFATHMALGGAEPDPTTIQRYGRTLTSVRRGTADTRTLYLLLVMLEKPGNPPKSVRSEYSALRAFALSTIDHELTDRGRRLLFDSLDHYQKKLTE
jgi:hypothetical protein